MNTFHSYEIIDQNVILSHFVPCPTLYHFTLPCALCFTPPCVRKIKLMSRRALVHLLTGRKPARLRGIILRVKNLQIFRAIPVCTPVAQCRICFISVKLNHVEFLRICLEWFILFKNKYVLRCISFVVFFRILLFSLRFCTIVKCRD